MKTKRMLIGLFLAGAIATGIVSCSKEVVEPTAKDDGNTALVNQVSGLTSDYLQAVTANGAALKNGRGKRIIGADLAGAFLGFLTLVGLNNDSDADNIANGSFAVAGGAAASIFASEEEGMAAPGNSGNATGNPFNPFDAFGRLHYEIIDEVNAHPSTYLNGHEVRFTEYYNLVFGQLVAEGMVTPSDRSHMPQSAAESVYNQAKSVRNIVEFMNTASVPGLEPSDRAIMGQYFGALMSSGDYSNFASYSIAVENLVNASSINARSKALLLTEMATARHGMAYWQGE